MTQESQKPTGSERSPQQNRYLLFVVVAFVALFTVYIVKTTMSPPPNSESGGSPPAQSSSGEDAMQRTTEQIAQLQELIKADARLDVVHFERVCAGAEEQADSPSPFFGDEFDVEEGFEMLDPTCLLTVVDTLTKMTEGLAFDPASGEMLD
jgi:hypothetical protein